MSMQAKIIADASGDITVYMHGGLDYCNTSPLKKELEFLLKENPVSVITLDMNSLDFVGSSGIGLFVETLKSLNANRERVKLANVKSEFLRVFKIYNFEVKGEHVEDPAMEALVSKFEDDETENLNKEFGNRSRTFEN